ncbi:MAG: SGNH/GDSL hydrolase family protein [Lachnospiraceae bacterium]|nr:SGNH/GDSL hydrolase family protein [Lachnospiraceae bacterium]
MRNSTKKKIIVAELFILCTLVVIAVAGVMLRTQSLGKEKDEIGVASAETASSFVLPLPAHQPGDSYASTDSAQSTPQETVEIPEEILTDEAVPGEEIPAAPAYPSYEPAQVRGDIATAQEEGASYAVTMAMDEEARTILANKHADTSQITITCFGDSLTKGVGAQSGYPDTIWRELAPFELYNLGLGGSPIAGFTGVATPMVYRYPEIPESSDIIIVFGGINDSFVCEEAGFGAPGIRDTFCGDVDHLFLRLIENYPAAKIFVVIPSPATEFDSLKEKNPGLLSQEAFRQELLNRAAYYGLEVVDLFDMNCLNPYDAMVRQSFFYDGCHLNDAGYEILGRILAARIVGYLQSR